MATVVRAAAKLARKAVAPTNIETPKAIFLRVVIIPDLYLLLFSVVKRLK